MVQELQRGPIACSIAVTEEFVEYTGGIFEDETGVTDHEHSISVIGYGTDETSGQDFWVARNSWGTVSLWGFMSSERGEPERERAERGRINKCSSLSEQTNEGE